MGGGVATEEQRTSWVAWYFLPLALSGSFTDCTLLTVCIDLHHNTFVWQPHLCLPLSIQGGHAGMSHHDLVLTPQISPLDGNSPRPWWSTGWLESSHNYSYLDSPQRLDDGRMGWWIWPSWGCIDYEACTPKLPSLTASLTLSPLFHPTLYRRPHIHHPTYISPSHPASHLHCIFIVVNGVTALPCITQHNKCHLLPTTSSLYCHYTSVYPHYTNTSLSLFCHHGFTATIIHNFVIYVGLFSVTCAIKYYSMYMILPSTPCTKNIVWIME